jgi:hypothetical protein
VLLLDEGRNFLRVAKDKLVWAGHSPSISPTCIWRLATVVVALKVITSVAVRGGLVLVPLQVQIRLPGRLGPQARA